MAVQAGFRTRLVTTVAITAACRNASHLPTCMPIMIVIDYNHDDNYDYNHDDNYDYNHDDNYDYNHDDNYDYNHDGNYDYNHDGNYDYNCDGNYKVLFWCNLGCF